MKALCIKSPSFIFKEGRLYECKKVTLNSYDYPNIQPTLERIMPLEKIVYFHVKTHYDSMMPYWLDIANTRKELCSKTGLAIIDIDESLLTVSFTKREFNSYFRNFI